MDGLRFGFKRGDDLSLPLTKAAQDEAADTAMKWQDGFDKTYSNTPPTGKTERIPTKDAFDKIFSTISAKQYFRKCGGIPYLDFSVPKSFVGLIADSFVWKYKTLAVTKFVMASDRTIGLVTPNSADTQDSMADARAVLIPTKNYYCENAPSHSTAEAKYECLVQGAPTDGVTGYLSYVYELPSTPTPKAASTSGISLSSLKSRSEVIVGGNTKHYFFSTLSDFGFSSSLPNTPSEAVPDAPSSDFSVDKFACVVNGNTQSAPALCIDKTTGTWKKTCYKALFDAWLYFSYCPSLNVLRFTPYELSSGGYTPEIIEPLPPDRPEKPTPPEMGPSYSIVGTPSVIGDNPLDPATVGNEVTASVISSASPPYTSITCEEGSGLVFIREAACKNNTSILSVDCGEAGIGEIEDEAFSYDPPVGTTLPDPVLRGVACSAQTEIGDKVFYHQSALRGVSGLFNAGSIGIQAFEGCTSLLGVDMYRDPTVSEGVIGHMTIHGRAFYGCASLKSLNMDMRYVIDIKGDNSGATAENKRGAFEGCTNLSWVDLPKCKSIGEDAFRDCSGIVYLTNFQSCESIADMAFFKCSSLEWVNDLEACKSVGEHAFTGTKIKYISMPSIETLTGFSRLEDSRDAGRPTITQQYLEYVDDAPSATSIDESAFVGCTGLKYVGKCPSVLEIKGSAFSGCSSLKCVGGEDGIKSVQEIRERAFFGCSSLTYLGNTGACMNIGESAFEGCTGITVLIKFSVLFSIGKKAFKGCTNLKALGDLSMMSTGTIVPIIGEDAFDGCTSLKYLYFRFKTFEDVQLINGYNNIPEGTLLVCQDGTFAKASTHTKVTYNENYSVATFSNGVVRLNTHRMPVCSAKTDVKSELSTVLQYDYLYMKIAQTPHAFANTSEVYGDGAVKRVDVDWGVFGTKVNGSNGTYIFTYVAAQHSWRLPSSYVTISQYGISYTMDSGVAEPANGCTITIRYNGYSHSDGYEGISADWNEDGVTRDQVKSVLIASGGQQCCNRVYIPRGTCFDFYLWSNCPVDFRFCAWMMPVCAE